MSETISPSIPKMVGGDIFFIPIHLEYKQSYCIILLNKQNNMTMVAKDKVYEFLNSLQWKRFNKVGLELELERFFGVEMKLYNSTCEDCTDIDFSFITTTAPKEFATRNFIDIEIYYAKTRKRGHFIITETTLLDYVE